MSDKFNAYYKNYYTQFALDAELFATVRESEAERDERWLRGLFGLIPQPKGRVLVIGSGTCGLCVALSKLSVELGITEIVGIDIDEDALEAAEEFHQLSKLSNVRVTVGDACNLPFEDGYFDYAFSVSVLEHVVGWQASLKEVRRVLKAGGKFFLNVPNYAFPREPHYKVLAPTFFGRSCVGLWLSLLGKPAGEIDTINFFTKTQVIRELQGNFETVTDLGKVRYRKTRHPWRGLGAFVNLIFVSAEFLGIYGTAELVSEKR